jgi:hemoglobin
MLRARHMPFKISIRERDQWPACIDQVMGETGVDDELRRRLNESFFQTADWMRNLGEQAA